MKISPLQRKCFFAFLLFMFPTILVAQTTTSTQTFYHSTTDQSDEPLIINTSTTITVNQNQPIQSITILDAYHADTWASEGCTDYAYFYFNLTVDGTDVLTQVCLDDLIGYNLTGSQEFKVSVFDTASDDTEDDIEFSLELEIVHDSITCPQVISISSTTIGTADASIIWSSIGDETSWNVEYGLPGFTPGAGISLSTVPTQAFSMSNLDPNTIYQVRIVSDCGNELSAAAIFNFRTLCVAVPSSAICESFGSESTSLACWTFLDNNNDSTEYSENYWRLQEYYLEEQGMVAQFQTSWDQDTNDDYLISPQVNIEPNTRMTFKYNCSSPFKVKLSTTGKEAADFTTLLATIAGGTNYEFVDTVLDLSAYSGNVYIAFVIDSTGQDMYQIDDVCFPICNEIAGIDGSITVCRADDTLNLYNVITTTHQVGTWNNTTLQGMISGNVLDISTLAAGTYNFEYRSINVCFLDTVQASVTVYNTVNAGNDNSFDVCKDQNYNLAQGLTGNFTGNGTWSTSTGTVTASQTAGNAVGTSTFYYVINNTVCPADTAIITVNTLDCNFLSIASSSLDEISVYPNPTTGLINLTGLIEGQNYTIQVVDLNGKVVKTQTVQFDGSSIVDLSTVDTGIYVVKINDEVQEKHVRIIKK